MNHSLFLARASGPENSAIWCRNQKNSLAHLNLQWGLRIVGSLAKLGVNQTVDGQNPALLGNHGKPLFVGIHRGIISLGIFVGAGFRPSTVSCWFFISSVGAHQPPDKRIHVDKSTYIRNARAPKPSKGCTKDMRDASPRST